jgi:hypothetical protein
LYLRRELALAQSLFDRFLAAIGPLPLGFLAVSIGGLCVRSRQAQTDLDVPDVTEQTNCVA